MDRKRIFRLDRNALDYSTLRVDPLLDELIIMTVMLSRFRNETVNHETIESASPPRICEIIFIISREIETKSGNYCMCEINGNTYTEMI